MSAIQKPRGQWSSKIAFIFAAAGSAVGLGNIWRFPYVTGENGGGAFVFLYLLVIVLLGFPVMLLELSMGRASEKNPVGAFRVLRPGSPWVFVGFMGVLTGIAILSYYTVIAGWTIAYLIKSISMDLDPKAFSTFIADVPQQITYFMIFLLVSVGVVAGGVKDGIERITRVLMPVLVGLMILLIIRSVTLEGALSGLEFYLVPDFSKVSAKTLIYAIGQGFFSLSLGMGAMITYGSYISKKDNLVSSGAWVCLFDTVIALMSGLIIFPALASAGQAPEAGFTLVFDVLISLFNQMPLGSFVAIVFFFLLSIAALTSTISLVEVATAYLVDERNIPRGTAVLMVAGVTAVLGIPCALSLGGSDFFTNLLPLGNGQYKSFLGIMDFMFGNMALSLGALLLCIFVVYSWKVSSAVKEISSGNSGFQRYAIYWLLALKYVAPLAIAAILIYMVVTGQTLS